MFYSSTESLRYLLLSLIITITYGLTAQIPELYLSEAVLLQRVEADTRDDRHFAALADLIKVKSESLFGQPASGDDPTVPIHPYLTDLKELAIELGEPYLTKARIVELGMNARLCFDHTPERRKLIEPIYTSISDSLGFGTSPEELDLRLDLFTKMYFQCMQTWGEADSNRIIGERIYNTPSLQDSQRVVLSLYLILDYMIYGNQKKGREIIQRALRTAEEMRGGHITKARLYMMVADFFEQFSGDYERGEELLVLAQQNLVKSDPDLAEYVLPILISKRINNYKFQEKAAQALALLDSLEAMLPPMTDEISSITDELNNQIIRLGLCRTMENTDCQSVALATDQNLSRVITKETPFPRVSFSAASELGLYRHFLGENQQARKHFDLAFDAMNTMRFEGPVLKVEMLKAYSKVLDDDTETAKKLLVNRYLVKAQDYILETEMNNAASKEAFTLDVSENKLARQRAEQESEISKQQAAADQRFYLTFLTGMALLLALIGYFFYRAQRDRQIITSQKALVDQSLSEKEVLLREIHHRVKNNLQIISSLLQKQARFSSDGDAQKLAKEGQERIQSMALVHENLYQSEQLSGVNIRSYLEDLGANISRSHSKPDSGIELELVVEDEYLNLDTAIPVGLILNELLTNAYKYAFPEGKAGQIQVVFQRIGDCFELEVNDNGVGLPTDHADRSSKSLGHNLVKGLVRQLEGNIKWLKPEQGTAVKIEFQLCLIKYESSS